MSQLVFNIHKNPEKVGSRASQGICEQKKIDDFANKSESKQTKKLKLPSSVSFFLGCHPKEWPRLREILPNSNGPIKKTS